MNYILFIVGLALLTFCADMLTRGCVGLAARFRVPEFIVGLTIMAIGTSMPEFTVSFMSALKGSGEMAIGNVTGSNIFNILIILGICALLRPMDITRENIRRDMPICIGVSILLWLFTSDTLLGWGAENKIGRLEGVVFMLMYVAVIFYSIRTAKGEGEVSDDAPKMGVVKIAAFILLGLGGLIFSGNLCLESATAIARAWGVSEAIIAITIVAAGTSLPELASSVSALVSGKTSLALGNIIGSNIANILLILGTCSTITPLTLGDITQLDMLMVVGAAIILLISALVIGRRRITRLEGTAYIAIYVAYVIALMK